MLVSGAVMTADNPGNIQLSFRPSEVAEYSQWEAQLTRPVMEIVTSEFYLITSKSLLR